MSRALLMSSFVASSRVGGGAQSLALAVLGIDTVLAPTVLFGRHPGLGAPGGGAVSPDLFQGVLDGIEAKGDFSAFDLVLTGYFSHPDQVEAAAKAIDSIRAARAEAKRTPPLILVDPVMGDTGKGLYVKAEVAEALARHLVPRADILAPNAWELSHLSGQAVSDPASALNAARSMGRSVMVSSVPCEAGLSVVLALKDEAWLVTHAHLTSAPNGVGDLLAALMAQACLAGIAPHHALSQAVGGVFEAIKACESGDHGDLPIVAMGKRLIQGSDQVSLILLD
jgi:pyridoxine kinase